MDISTAEQHWSFFKADRTAAYTYLPLNPEEADACIETIRNPPDGIRYGFRPTALLFGAVAAALRYNCFSRTITVLANWIIGIPTVDYFDDI